MATPINIGVDFGSLGWRAAYQAGSQTILVSCDEKDALLERRLCYESSKSTIGTTFPSFKSKLGTGERLVLNGDQRTADELITEDLSALSQRIKVQTSQPMGQAVISVPANYSALRRTALRDAALHAGFSDVHLLNDSMAAVMHFTSQDRQAATLLVYGIGYAGFEIGLVRSAHSHYRTLGYESGPIPGGAAWDELFLASWLSYFVRQSLALIPPPAQWTTTQWLEVRLAAQQVKEALSLADEAAFPIPVSIPNSLKPLSAHYIRSDLETAIAPSINVTLEITERILAEANLTAKDVDAILLTGGSTRAPLVHSLLEHRFGKKPISLEAEALAKGAARYATQLEVAPPPATLLGEASESSPETTDIPKGEMPVLATVTTKEAASPQSPARAWLNAVPLFDQYVQSDSAPPNVLAAREVVLRHVRHLIEQGEARQAKLFIQKIGQDAHKLFNEVQPLTQPTHEGAKPLQQQRAERAISQAYQLLKDHKEEEAVMSSHMAWQSMPDSPDIFDKMIDIHCQAAMAKTELESYDQSRKWLECALSHDQSNSRTREALAERHYLQAKQLAERGKRKEALAAIEQCLHWNPEHDKGVGLNATLT